MLTEREIIAAAVGDLCPACGVALTVPGEYCSEPGCGSPPEPPREKAPEVLRGHARDRMRRAEAAQGQAGQLWAEHDWLAHRAAMEEARLTAQAVLAARREDLEDAGRALAAARRPAEAALARAEDARAEHARCAAADEAAARDDPRDQRRTLLEVNAAAVVLQRAEEAAWAPVQALHDAQAAAETARSAVPPAEAAVKTADIAAARSAPPAVSRERQDGDLVMQAEGWRQMAAAAMLTAQSAEAEAAKTAAAGRGDRLIVPTGAGHAAVVSTRSPGSQGVHGRP